MSGQQAKLIWEDLATRVTPKERHSREILDVAAFRRLVEADFDGRPNDEVGSFAWRRDQKKAERAAKRAANARLETAE